MPTTILDSDILKGFSPMSGLTREHLGELISKTAIQRLDTGHYLFRQQDTGRHNVYLLAGTVEIRSDDRIVSTITGGSDAARHPLAPHIPRQVSARAASDIEYIQIDTDFLDLMLTWDQSGAFEVEELQAQGNEEHDWMSAVLQVNAFHRIPPANIQALFMRMQPITCKQGAVIVRQGEVGDYFYILTRGRCSVTREAPNNKKPIALAELMAGASFGEDALLTEFRRNATVTTLTDCVLVRLAQEDFKVLLIEPQQQRIDLEQAKRIVAAGGQWLDVRLPSEFEQQHPDGALNLPLHFIRLKFDSLDLKRKYVVCCDTGRRSSAGAFILSERGFDVYILKNGLSGYAAY